MWDIFLFKIVDIFYRRFDIVVYFIFFILLRILEMILGVEVIFLFEVLLFLMII